MSGIIPPSEQYKVMRLVKRESSSEAVCPQAALNAVDFANASGSLRQVNDSEIRELTRTSTAALLTAIESGDDTAQI